MARDFGTDITVRGTRVLLRGETLSSPRALLPTGAKADTTGRLNTFANASVLTSGRLYLVAIPIVSDETLTSATFISGTTALSGGTNQWFALYDSSRNLLRQTSDDGATAWAGTSTKTLNFSSTFTTTYSGLYYLGLMVAATTVPSLLRVNSQADVAALPPILAGNSTTGLTSTAPDPAAAIIASANLPYAYVS